MRNFRRAKSGGLGVKDFRPPSSLKFSPLRRSESEARIFGFLSRLAESRKTGVGREKTSLVVPRFAWRTA